MKISAPKLHGLPPRSMASKDLNSIKLSARALLRPYAERHMGGRKAIAGGELHVFTPYKK